MSVFVRQLRFVVAAGLVLLLSACANLSPPGGQIASAPSGAGQTYVVFGRRYYVLPTAHDYARRGIASWYGPNFHGKLTASGVPYNMYAMTAASKVLPLGTFVRVTNLENGKKVIVEINDRGPFVANRIIDLSYTAASRLSMIGPGTALVEVQAINPNNPSHNPPPPLDAAHGGPTPHIYIQVGAFSRLINARRYQARLALRGFGPMVIQSGQQGSQGILYFLRLGPIASVNAADAAAKRMNALGIQHFQVGVE